MSKQIKPIIITSPLQIEKSMQRENLSYIRYIHPPSHIWMGPINVKISM